MIFVHLHYRNHRYGNEYYDKTRIRAGRNINGRLSDISKKMLIFGERRM